MSSPAPPRQTTVLIGGSNGTKTLCSILGDTSHGQNQNHTIRVVTRNTRPFLTSNNTPREWRCNEQKALSDLLPSSLLPTTWITHVGAPSSVFPYEDIENAICGESAVDDGGVADVILLACPVYAHLPILRHVARALYNLNSKKKLLNHTAPPLLIGTLYAAGGFDWMCRLAFSREKTSEFSHWHRPMALFGLKSFPYLTKSVTEGEVTLYGRYPILTCAVSPSTPRVRAHARRILERVLQCDCTGKSLCFLGISGNEGDGGDGSGTIVDAVALQTLTSAASRNQKQQNATTLPMKIAPLPSRSTVRSMADLADPYSSLGFLSSTLNATNQFLHPCIIAALFENPADGSVVWDETKNTELPRFYGDGASLPEAGRLICEIGMAEYYPLMYTMDKILAPSGMQPICTQHGGEPVGRFVLNEAGNSPQDVAGRTGLTDMVLERELMIDNGENVKMANIPDRYGVIKYQFVLEKLMSYGLSHNSRLGAVLSPAYRDKETNLVKPKTNTRFFIDDIPHGLCLALGLGEMLGFDLERDMKETLFVVRRLQLWMGKEYVQPHGIKGGIVAGARDLGETSAPQAFGIKTIGELRDFLRMCPFADNVQQRMEQRVNRSILFEQERSKL
eukprot:CAMPEP_0172516350 /NCGR_PEP_ID=MMETSP1066-20121228/275627_1 /TAXON_ID=671091 /ORGANISM="Coscinodiscus wailesii, Strain CCMP2513" /LENGTH=619 /DNA_ID=CAMNT_0013297791 /DNA_START=66 /DNA_END=1925 /DNA_ORIENTATION=+